MTINQYTITTYKGIASDIKPSTGPIGSEFIETDTNNIYIYDGTTWRLRGSLSGKFYDENGGTMKGLYFNAEAPQVCSQPYLYAVAEGDITGHSNFAKYGRVTASTTGPIDVWPFGGTYAFPSTAGQGVQVICANSCDLSTGTGLQKIKILYLDTDYNEQTTEVTLNGKTAVNCSTNMSRINNVYASAAGTLGIAAGNIDICATGATSPHYARIETNLTQTRQLIYTVPSSKELYITSARMSAGVSTANKFQYVIFTLLASADPGTGAASTIFYPQAETGLINDAIELNFEAPIKVPAYADVKFRVQGDTTEGSACSAAIRGWIE